MPPTDQMIDEAVEALSKVRLGVFLLQPTDIVPFQSATLSWRVSVEGGNAAEFTLRLSRPGLSTRVPLQGTRNVSPLRSGTYTLSAVRAPFSQVLATRAITVETSDCIDGSIPESEIEGDIHAIVDEFLIDKPELSRRGSGETVLIGTPGILLHLRFKAEINNWADPDINVDALIRIHAEAGQIRHTLASFKFDIDFPWWADLAHSAFMPAWLSLAIKEGNEGAEVRAFLDSRIAALLARQQQAVEDAGFRFLAARTEVRQVSYTICPAQASPTFGTFAGKNVVAANLSG